MRLFRTIRTSVGVVLVIPFFISGCATMGGLQAEPLDKGQVRTFDAPARDVTRIAVDAVHQTGLEIEDVQEVDAQTWMILAKHGASGWSSGELVRVVVQGGSARDATIVRIITKKKVATQVGAEGDYSGEIFSKIYLMLGSLTAENRPSGGPAPVRTQPARPDPAILAEGVSFPDPPQIVGTDLIPVRVEPKLTSDIVIESVGQAVVTVLTRDGLGSGVVVHEEGLVLTNAHVVEDAQYVAIRTGSGREIPGRVLRTSDGVDAALIQILCEESCAVASAGSISEVRQGDEVLAFGSPLGLERTVSKGIVSSIRRFDDATWIQTDAAINSGNSGGPLVDVSTGRILGLNTMGVRKDLGEGLNFAVAIDDALSALGLIRQ